MSTNKKHGLRKGPILPSNIPDPAQRCIRRTTNQISAFSLAASLMLGIAVLPWRLPALSASSARMPGGSAASPLYPYDSIEALLNDDETVIFQISGRSMANDFFDYMASHVASIDGVSHLGKTEILETPGYCSHGYTRRFAFLCHDRNYVIENCDYAGYESIAQDAAALPLPSWQDLGR